MTLLTTAARRLKGLAAHLDTLSLRERGLIFAAGVTLVSIAWQTLLMGPITARTRSAEQRLTATQRQLAAIEKMGASASDDPLVAAAARNRALAEHLAVLEGDLNEAAQGYIAPEKMPDLLRALLEQQHGLTLVSLDNLPVESLSPVSTDHPRSQDRGPFLHPVEIVVDGNYGSVVAYLKAIEDLPWRIHWQRLQLDAGESPVNRVRIVIDALSLSRDWIAV